MAKLLGRELLLILALGLFACLGLPLLFGGVVGPSLPLFILGVVVGLSIAPLYAIALLAGRRLSPVALAVVGVVAWLLVYLNDYLRYVPGHAATSRLLIVGTGFLGVLLAALAAVRAPRPERGPAAARAFYLFALPMLMIRYLLVPMVQVNAFVSALALQGGALFMFLHGVLRLVAPLGPEDPSRQEPLMRRRAVPDAVVGLAEGTVHLRARPWATRPDGSADESLVSLPCPPERVEAAVERLTGALQNTPFTAAPGEQVDGKVEIVIRPRG